MLENRVFGQAGGGKHCIARIYGILLCRIRQQTVHTGLARRI